MQANYVNLFRMIRQVNCIFVLVLASTIIGCQNNNPSSWSTNTSASAQFWGAPPSHAQSLWRDAAPADMHTDVLKQAEIALSQGQVRQSLRLLANIHNPTQLARGAQQRYYELLADSYLRSGNVVESIRAREQLRQYVQGRALLDNNDDIWRLILSLDSASLHTLSLESDELMLKAWAELAFIVKQYEMNSPRFHSAIYQWRSVYRDHPGQDYLPQRSPALSQQQPQSSSKQIALLLPLNGPLAQAGQAIRDGFMAAFYQSQQQSGGELPNIRVYDSSQTNDINTLYQTAVNDGADAVVGPLAPNKVAQLSRQRQMPVPTLALNFDMQQKRSPQGLYQFGISPVTEAGLVADRAILNGARRAFVISPANPRAQQIREQFSKNWQAQGGRIVGQLQFAADDDLDKTIKDALHVTASEQRAANLRRILNNRQIKASPRRRQDIDVIFLIANAEQGRQIRPLLKFHYAGDIPVYATSMIYTGRANPQQDRDLDGIIFSDIPWIFSDKQQAHNNTMQDARLYALGLDAYYLARQLQHLNAYQYKGIPSYSGLLTMDQQQRISRPLGWAQFNQGTPQLLQSVSSV